MIKTTLMAGLLMIGLALGVATPASAQDAESIADRQFHRGMEAYRIGDYLAAATLLERACDGGDALGCATLGALYSQGQGVTQDDARAASLYSRACDGGDAMGCRNLGGLYTLGNGVAQDYARAEQFARRALELDPSDDRTQQLLDLLIRRRR